MNFCVCFTADRIFSFMPFLFPNEFFFSNPGFKPPPVAFMTYHTTRAERVRRVTELPTEVISMDSTIL